MSPQLRPKSRVARVARARRRRLPVLHRAHGRPQLLHPGGAAHAMQLLRQDAQAQLGLLARLGQKPEIIFVNIPIPTKIGSKMGGEFTYPQNGTIGSDPQPPDAELGSRRVPDSDSEEWSVHFFGSWVAILGVHFNKVWLLFRAYPLRK